MKNEKSLGFSARIWVLIVCLGVTASPLCYAEGLWPFGGGGSQETGPMVSPSETLYAKTPDGWKIALTHFPPAPGTTPRKFPVILCHGFGYNANFWMLDSSAHLPGYLSSQGFDVWVPSLRGSGKSTKWMFKIAEVGGEAAGLAMQGNAKDDPIGLIFGAAKIVKGIGQAQLNNASADPKYMNWTYDDYVQSDVPTILSFVKDKTGKKKVHWVGHSMGGNILMCHLTQKPEANDNLVSLFTIGSQLTMEKGTVFARQLQNMEALRLLELQGNASDLATAKQISQDTNNKMFFNLSNADPQIVEKLNEIGLDTPGMGVLGQYMALSDTGRCTTADKKIDYTGAASNIQVPAFFSAGKKDSFVNAQDIDFLIKNVSSPTKESQIYGKGNGFGANYGHNDAFISSNAGREIYPLVGSWLAMNEGTKKDMVLKKKDELAY